MTADIECCNVLWQLLSFVGSGFPTGILRERATELIMAVMNRGRTFEEKRKFISEGLSICAQVSVNVFR